MFRQRVAVGRGKGGHKYSHQKEKGDIAVVQKRAGPGGPDWTKSTEEVAVSCKESRFMPVQWFLARTWQSKE